MAPDHLSAQQMARRRIFVGAVLLVVTAGGLAFAVRSGANPRTPTARSRRPDETSPSNPTATTTSTGSVTAPTSSSTSTTTTDPDEATGLFTTSSISGYLDAHDSDINAAVYDIDDGASSLYRPGALEYTASIVKVDILATLLQQAQKSGDGLSDEEQDLATTMIENSDDDAASDLWDDIGQQAGLAAYNSLIPLKSTVPGTDGHWGGTTTTAADQVSLLRQIVQTSKILDPASQGYELGLMENIESDQAWGVTAGVPSGVTVALKNGWLPLEDDGDWQVNSIGWIDGDGRDYVIAVLSKDNSTEADGIDTIEGLSKLVWNSVSN